MASPLSIDLRERVVAAVAEGASFHRAAARFGVSVSSASRWSQRFAQQGYVVPEPTHSDDSLPAIEAHADLILSLDKARPELFLRELRDALAEQGVHGTEHQHAHELHQRANLPAEIADRHGRSKHLQHCVYGQACEHPVLVLGEASERNEKR